MQRGDSHCCLLEEQSLFKARDFKRAVYAGRLSGRPWWPSGGEPQGSAGRGVDPWPGPWDPTCCSSWACTPQTPESTCPGEKATRPSRDPVCTGKGWYSQVSKWMLKNPGRFSMTNVLSGGPTGQDTQWWSGLRTPYSFSRRCFSNVIQSFFKCQI